MSCVASMSPPVPSVLTGCHEMLPEMSGGGSLRGTALAGKEVLHEPSGATVSTLPPRVVWTLPSPQELCALDQRSARQGQGG